MQPFFQDLNAGRHYKNTERVFFELAFKVQSSLNVNVKNYRLPPGPDLLYLRAKSAIMRAGIHLFPFKKLIVFNLLFKFINREVVVVFSVLFYPTFWTAGSTDRKFDVLGKSL